jgi:hypothetical protein
LLRSSGEEEGVREAVKREIEVDDAPTSGDAGLGCCCVVHEERMRGGAGRGKGSGRLLYGEGGRGRADKAVEELGGRP